MNVFFLYFTLILFCSCSIRNQIIVKNNTLINNSDSIEKIEMIAKVGDSFLTLFIRTKSDPSKHFTIISKSKALNQNLHIFAEYYLLYGEDVSGKRYRLDKGREQVFTLLEIDEERQLIKGFFDLTLSNEYSINTINLKCEQFSVNYSTR